MRYASWMIKPVSSTCDLRCRYCFYQDVSCHREIQNYGKMSRNVLDYMLDNIFDALQDGDDLTLSFQGGEPTLAGLDFFYHMIGVVASQEKRVKLHYSLQTNGLLLDNDWCVFLAKNNFLVGLSLDGDAPMHDANRVDAYGNGTFSKVLSAKTLLELHQVQYNVLCTLTEYSAQHADAIWNFFKQQHVEYLQFTPCLGKLEQAAPELWQLTPERFAEFYCRLFDLWAADFWVGRYISVKFIDDIMNLLTRQIITACGFNGQCNLQNIVEADGGVYPCDFFVLDEWRMGSVLDTTLSELGSNSAAKRFLTRTKEKCLLCEDCQWAGMCGGGCPRMTHSMYWNQAGTFCGYREFLQKKWPEIRRVATTIHVMNRRL